MSTEKSSAGDSKSNHKFEQSSEVVLGDQMPMTTSSLYEKSSESAILEIVCIIEPTISTKKNPLFYQNEYEI